MNIIYAKYYHNTNSIYANKCDFCKGAEWELYLFMNPSCNQNHLNIFRIAQGLYGKPAGIDIIRSTLCVTIVILFSLFYQAAMYYKENLRL